LVGKFGDNPSLIAIFQTANHILNVALQVISRMDCSARQSLGNLTGLARSMRPKLTGDAARRRSENLTTHRTT
jgi:hypothetical protein